jgi:hypothetical protein
MENKKPGLLSNDEDFNIETSWKPSNTPVQARSQPRPKPVTKPDLITDYKKLEKTSKFQR